MDKFEELMNIYNKYCEGYEITIDDLIDKQEDESDDSISISGTFNKLGKEYIYSCSYYPDGCGNAEINLMVVEKGKSIILQKAKTIEDTIEY